MQKLWVKVRVRVRCIAYFAYMRALSIPALYALCALLLCLPLHSLPATQLASPLHAELCLSCDTIQVKTPMDVLFTLLAEFLSAYKKAQQEHGALLKVVGLGFGVGGRHSCRWKSWSLLGCMHV